MAVKTFHLARCI